MELPPDLVLTNPRREALIPDWPLNSSERGVAHFYTSERTVRGNTTVRVSRTTTNDAGRTGKPLHSRYYKRMVILDGSVPGKEGVRTYIAAESEYGQRILYAGTLRDSVYLQEDEHVQLWHKLGALLSEPVPAR